MGISLTVKYCCGLVGELAAVEADEAEGDAVGGQDGDAGGVHVDEGHHHGCSGKAGAGRFCRRAMGRRRVGVGVDAEFGGALVHVGGGGFVAVVAVGDDELLVVHGVENLLDEAGSVSFQTRWTTPYSSVISRSGGMAAGFGAFGVEDEFSAVKVGSE